MCPTRSKMKGKLAKQRKKSSKRIFQRPLSEAEVEILSKVFQRHEYFFVRGSNDFFVRFIFLVGWKHYNYGRICQTSMNEKDRKRARMKLSIFEL